jgi:hypothetical protein
MVCRKVLAFDPSDTIPHSITAIDPIAATSLDSVKPSNIQIGNATLPAIAAFRDQCNLTASLGDLSKSLELRFAREIS